MRPPTVVLASIAALTITGLLLIWLGLRAPLPAANTPALNEALHAAEASWPQLSADDLAPVPGGVTVLSPQGSPLYSDDDHPPVSALDAESRRLLSAPLVVDDEVVATVYVDDDLAVRARNGAITLAWALTIVLALTALASAALAWHTYLRVAVPFRRMERFAADVAAGKLDAPLNMDRGNAFGVWTESFDMMRSELAAARDREQAARQANLDLINQIGHDLRTPVASIAATAELLRLTEDDPDTQARLENVSAKAEQLATLMHDLFQANSEQLGSLTVDIQEMDARVLSDLIRRADHRGMVAMATIPGCLITIDPNRLGQVFDNIIENSYKYAGTPIAVTAVVDDDTLAVTFRDTGGGVPDDELGPILARGVRGSNVDGKPGDGLGLFTCAHLMERMAGDLVPLPDADGFSVQVRIALA